MYSCSNLFHCFLDLSMKISIINVDGGFPMVSVDVPTIQYNKIQFPLKLSRLPVHCYQFYVGSSVCFPFAALKLLIVDLFCKVCWGLLHHSTQLFDIFLFKILMRSPLFIMKRTSDYPIFLSSSSSHCSILCAMDLVAFFMELEQIVNFR